MGSIQCNACGIWNGYWIKKPKYCGLCGRPINSEPLSQKEKESLLPKLFTPKR